MFINGGRAGEQKGKRNCFFFYLEREKKEEKIIAKTVNFFSSRCNKAKNIGQTTGVKGEKSLMSWRWLCLGTFCLTETSIIPGFNAG